MFLLDEQILSVTSKCQVGIPAIDLLEKPFLPVSWRDEFYLTDICTFKNRALSNMFVKYYELLHLLMSFPSINFLSSDTMKIHFNNIPLMNLMKTSFRSFIS